MIVEERDEIVMILASLGQQIQEGEITQRLHDHTVALEVITVSERTVVHKESIVIAGAYFFAHLGVLLHVPDRAAFLGVAGSTDVQMVVYHDFFRSVGGVIFGLGVEQEVHAVVGVEDAV